MVVEENARGIDVDEPTSRRTAPDSARINGATAGVSGARPEASSINLGTEAAVARTDTLAGAVKTGGGTRPPTASEPDDSGPTEPPRSGMRVPTVRRSEPSPALAATDATPRGPPNSVSADRAFAARADRGPAFDFSARADPADGPEAELDPGSALGPAVSADATPCMEAIAAPTPTATANAPTRPR